MSGIDYGRGWRNHAFLILLLIVSALISAGMALGYLGARSWAP